MNGVNLYMSNGIFIICPSSICDLNVLIILPSNKSLST